MTFDEMLRRSDINTRRERVFYMIDNFLDGDDMKGSRSLPVGQRMSKMHSAARKFIGEGIDNPTGCEIEIRMFHEGVIEELSDKAFSEMLTNNHES